ncbi:hypothetical protein PRIPAC_71300 [Pristionchus pacificus]|uniref:Protein kinase domain-containing protein n=1 Tax=Pristionchus pacificus TaxID=54126 RepID=A0A2A6CRZ0_PRIPA|nr:hypothetical protein PRIPAC_71300 [Pristionchus pacificus]|eukprot:PDM80813.1 protein kinase [Pristionchus pacificus]
MPFFDFFKSRFKKKSSSDHKQPVSGDGSKASRRSIYKDEPSANRSVLASPSSQMDATQMYRPNQVTKKRTSKKKSPDNKFHKPVTQTAEDVRNKQQVSLNLEELHWHSGGVFSNVYRGKLVSPEKMEIAIKKTWPKDSVRSDEMIILAAMRRANPRNIIKLLYIFRNTAIDGTECEAFIFGYMPETLDKVIKRGVNIIDMKIYIWQLFNGLDFLAANRIAHRDIKPINILVNRDSGELQIGDFGSAKVISSKERSSSYQVTRYYRPPEMLLGSSHYSHLIDVWSAGCVLGEMIKGRVLFRGTDSDHQMQLIQAAFGPPTENEIRLMKLDPKKVKLKNITQHGILTTLRLQGENSDPSKFTPVIKSAVKLLERVLVFIPENRLSGKEFLEDPFFEDVLSANCLRENGRKPDLQRQSDDTMCHQCFERSQRSSRDNRVSQMAAPPEKENEQPPSTKQVEPSSNEHKGEDGDSSTADKEAAKEAAAPQLLEPPSRISGGRKG